MDNTVDFLDAVLKLSSFAGVVVCIQIWFMKKIKEGQAELRQHHASDNKILMDAVKKSIKNLSKKVKKKVSKEECEQFRRTCPRGCLNLGEDHKSK